MHGAILRSAARGMRLVVMLTALPVLASAFPQPARAAGKPRPLIVFMTDFGTLDSK